MWYKSPCIGQSRYTLCCWIQLLDRFLNPSVWGHLHTGLKHFPTLRHQTALVSTNWDSDFMCPVFHMETKSNCWQNSEVFDPLHCFDPKVSLHSCTKKNRPYRTTTNRLCDFVLGFQHAGFLLERFRNPGCPTRLQHSEYKSLGWYSEWSTCNSNGQKPTLWGKHRGYAKSFHYFFLPELAVHFAVAFGALGFGGSLVEQCFLMFGSMGTWNTMGNHIYSTVYIYIYPVVWL